MFAVWRKPACQQLQAPPDFERREVLRAADHMHVVPQAMHVLSRGSSEGGTPVTLEAPAAGRADGARQKRPFLSNCFLVDLTADVVSQLRVQQ